MEVYPYQACLIIEEELYSGKNQAEAINKAKEIFNNKEHDFISGIFQYERKQNAFYEFEIDLRFSRAGFKEIKKAK